MNSTTPARAPHGRAHLLAVGTAVPGPRISNADLAEHFGMDELWEQWVDAFVDTRGRHLATNLETGEAEYSLADLGELAGRRAMAAAGLAPGQIDLVVMGTATPDQLMPATVNVIAERLGIDQVPTYQLQSGCAGAVQALDLAVQLLAAGRHRTALVLGGDTGTKHHDPDLDLDSLSPGELINVVLFGDGAGAAVVGARPAPGAVELREVFVRLTGMGVPPGQVIEWYGSAAGPARRRTAGHEDYKAIEDRVPVMAREILDELLDTVGWSPEELDYVLPPQLSGRMTARILERLAVPEAAEISCVREVGNNGNALVFFQLEQLLGRMKSGEHAVGIAVESSKWIKAGFALERP